MNEKMVFFFCSVVIWKWASELRLLLICTCFENYFAHYIWIYEIGCDRCHCNILKNRTEFMVKLQLSSIFRSNRGGEHLDRSMTKKKKKKKKSSLNTLDRREYVVSYCWYILIDFVLRFRSDVLILLQYELVAHIFLNFFRQKFTECICLESECTRVTTTKCLFSFFSIHPISLIIIHNMQCIHDM